MSKPHYTVQSLPQMRQLIADIGWFAKQTDPILGLLEIDVTDARMRIQAYKAETGEQLSFTAFLVNCVAQAVDEAKEVHAMYDWRGRLVIFDEVDVTTMIEIVADGHKTPVGHIVRAANHKNLPQIHQEIREVQGQQAHSKDASFVRFFTRIPRPMRKLLIRFLYRMPQLLKKTRGTVVVTAVGMFGKNSGYAVTLPSHSLVVLVGSIVKKPGVINDQICIREYLHLTLAFDHKVVDGAPAARFAARVVALIEGAYGLEELSGAVNEHSPVPAPRSVR